MKKLFFMSCITITTVMSSCTTDSIEETNTSASEISANSTPNPSNIDSGGDSKDKDKGNN
ncbi:hypothetical protein [Flavobacterium macrobrachii]|jgi:hypothetical protein|uniref:Uncharacterized protein n=1 Tax=Flavobacterium macrobrachii TaxID=591204 RepID=A0ABS2CX64_9FLAO|nr:hypothetical protein [Flavobacterium macrobrachii]MBM6499549.1 hypothetical protein [Flavobacterium macrobrachii]